MKIENHSCYTNSNFKSTNSGDYIIHDKISYEDVSGVKNNICWHCGKDIVIFSHEHEVTSFVNDEGKQMILKCYNTEINRGETG